MRGSSKSLPKYAKHRASGQAVVRLCDKDFYPGPHGTKTSKLEYDRLIGEWLANGRRLAVEVKESPITIIQLFVGDPVNKVTLRAVERILLMGRQTAG